MQASAPCSASIRDATGPARRWVKSITRTPDRGRTPRPSGSGGLLLSFSISIAGWRLSQAPCGWTSHSFALRTMLPVRPSSANNCSKFSASHRLTALTTASEEGAQSRISNNFPDHPSEPAPPMSFFKASGNLLRGSRKTAGRKVRVIPCGHAMSSRRLFLSGLLSSRARLRFAGFSILPTQNPPRHQNHFANPRHRKTIGTSTQLLAQCKPNQGRISYLRIARSLS